MRHLHLRKRAAKHLEPYPATSFWKRLLDTTIYAVGVAGPILTIPQILLIYVGQDATGVSAVTWFGWAALNIPWILYGLVHNEKPIAITYVLWFFVNIAVGVGAILYG